MSVGQQIPFAFQQLFTPSIDASGLSGVNTAELSAQIGVLMLEYNTNLTQETVAQTRIGQSPDGVTVNDYQQWNKDGKSLELAVETSA